MKTKYQYILCLFMLGLVGNTLAQEKEYQPLNRVIHLGVMPSSIGEAYLRENQKFSEDNIVLGPYNSIGGQTIIDYSLAFQKYVKQDRLWNFDFLIHQGKADQFVLRDTFTAPDGMIPVPFIDPFETNPIKVGDIKELRLRFSTAHLWNLFRTGEKVMLNVGPSIVGEYYRNDIYRLYQVNGRLEKSELSGINLALAFQSELTWRFSPRFGFGIIYNGKILSHNIPLESGLDLNPDNPLNRAYFRPALFRSNAAIRLSFFF